MRLSIVDACFPLSRQSYGMAASWMKWYALNCGASVVGIPESDVVLVTCVDPRNSSVIASIRKKHPNKIIVSGGAGALSPYSLGLYSDAVCVGNGERFIKTLICEGFEVAKKLPESWVHGESRAVSVADGFPWNCPPIECEDGAFRVWCGRGCKKKCAFCQTGWSTKYEENPDEKMLLESVKSLQKNKKRFGYLSNDISQHTFYKSLPNVDHGSYSLDYIKRTGIPSSRQVRIGVEGVSERLRKYIGKSISNSDLVKSAAWLNQAGKSVRWFMIAGLPGEKICDWEEIKQVIMDWKRICSKGVLALSFTAWQPEPATPLAVAPVVDDYWEYWQSFREWFFGGVGWSNRIKIMPPASPNTRMNSSVARMGLPADLLRIGGQWGPNDRVMYPYKIARNSMAARMSTIGAV